MQAKRASCPCYLICLIFTPLHLCLFYYLPLWRPLRLSWQTSLINYIYFAVSIWTIFSLTGILKLRYQEPHLPRPYKVKVIFLIFFLYEIKDIGYRNSHCGAMGLAVPLEIWYIGSVLSPTQWFKDLEFPPLWYRSQLQLGLDLWPRNFVCHRGTTTSNSKIYIYNNNNNKIYI